MKINKYKLHFDGILNQLGNNSIDQKIRLLNKRYQCVKK